MSRHARWFFVSLATLAGAGLLMGSGNPPQQDPEQMERRLKDLEATRAGFEKRQADAEKVVQEMAARFKEAEQTRAAQEKRLADLQAQVQEAQAARAALEKRLVDGEKGSQQSADRLRQIETLGVSLESRLAEGEKRTQESANRLKELQVARATLEARVAEIDRARQELMAPLRELQAACVALEKRMAEADGSRKDLLVPLRALETARASMEPRLERLEINDRRFLDRMAAAENSGEVDRGRGLALRADLQRVKLALLSAGGNGADADARPAWSKSLEEHFATLGVVYEFAKGEGMRLVRVARHTPADAADLNHGDVVLRVNGVPVKTTGVTAPRSSIEKWWDSPQGYPNFVLHHMPGETVQLEYRRDGELDWVRVRLSCGKCGDACSFYRAPK